MIYKLLFCIYQYNGLGTLFHMTRDPFLLEPEMDFKTYDLDELLGFQNRLFSSDLKYIMARSKLNNGNITS